MISYLGSLVQFSPAAGRAGCCGQMSLCVEHSPCSGQAARSFGGLSPGAARLFPPRRAARAARGLAHSPQMWRAFSHRGPSRASGSLQIGTGPVCSVGRGGFSGAEFAPFLSPLPPTSSGDGAALLWSFSVPLFCEPPRCDPAG